jgi:glycosyltransferase involved in cell wall biosynthesis
MVMVPLYLPMVNDHEALTEAPILLGGINLFLQQKAGLFRHTPRWFDRFLDSGRLLRRASDFAGMTSAHDLGAMTLSSFEGLDGVQGKEWRRLVSWVKAEGKPDVVSLSNGLLSGVAAAIREDVGVPVIASFQGEDSFLDGLPQSYAAQSWEAYGKAAAHVDRFIAPSRYAGEYMERRLGLRPDRWEVVANGIDCDDFTMGDGLPAPPVIGFLSRLCPPKGLETVVESFLLLRRRRGGGGIRLHLGGAMTPEDKGFVSTLQARIEREGAGGDISWFPNMSFGGKQEFLRGLTLLSVPSRFPEVFGLFLIEAMASGVPVVQPRSGAFPEIVEGTGGGWIYDGQGAEVLADAWEASLSDEKEIARRGAAGRAGVERGYTAEGMAREYARIAEATVAKDVEGGAGIV